MQLRLIILICLLAQIASAQTDTLTIDMCYDLTYKNYPLVKEKQLNLSASDLKMKNIQTNYFPGITLNGQATYQSDAMKVDIDIPMQGVELPEGVKDQYKLTLDVNQVIYDGGLTTAQKELEKSMLNSEMQNIEVKLYQLRERVNQIYFIILLFQEKENLLAVMINELKARLETVKSGVKNGAVLAVNADILKAEILKIEQQLAVVQNGKATSFSVLEVLTGADLPDKPYLSMPEVEFPTSATIKRPETKLFENQQQKLDALTKLSDAQRMPKLVGFSQFGYGRPGLNMLSDEFDSYYIVGAKLTWNVFDWNKNKRQKQIYTVQRDIIKAERETFDKNIDIASEQELGNIEQLSIMINKDIEIIELRKKVTQTYKSQLDNGVITSTEYITELNAETQAKINLEVHKIQLLQAKVNYMTIRGR